MPQTLLLNREFMTTDTVGFSEAGRKAEAEPARARRAMTLENIWVGVTKNVKADAAWEFHERRHDQAAKRSEAQRGATQFTGACDE